MLDTGVDRALAEDGYVRFVRAGAGAKGEFHCAGCGYGVTVQERLPVCPMCAGETWEPSPWSPLTRVASHTL